MPKGKTALAYKPGAGSSFAISREPQLLIPDKIRSRTRDLQDIWKPVGIVLSILSAIKSIREFHHRSGPYFFGSLGMLALAIGILYTVPIKSVRLFVRRLVAFLIDVLLFGVVTTAFVSLLFEARIVRPSAITSMVIVWSWVSLWVLSEWRFAGTPGKLMLGLRLKDKRGSLSFLSCLARNLLTLVVPITLAGSIVSIPTMSRLVSSAQWSVAVAILSLSPLSIIFAGGHSLPDLLLGLAVLPKRSHQSEFPAVLSRRNWLFLVLVAVSAGVIYGFMPPLSDIRTLLERRQQLPLREVHWSVEEDSQVAANLWPFLRAGIQDPETYLQDVHVYSTLGDLPLRPEDGDLLAATPCQQAFDTKKGYKVVRLQFDPGTPTLFATAVFANMFRTTDRFGGRPAFLVLETSSRRSFGVFTLELPEDYVLCLAGSDATPKNNVVGISPSVRVEASINGLAWLFLGDLGKYSYIEKVPVYP